ncbi:ribonuclease Y [Thermosulfuriphilus ammonigenes]|uniref:Ribonuclease Y n=1 Tax=Thermosulfuriphilus ammonigenes TaxID=1936021 RepID=A0A6G7PVT7_9BACT|nr:ribonuclease Y [Thermosulfuriphilus ammonigenes]MBA2848045.1 ribonuclease Y [Thermosulfuriphilus ammonigenes]QIJ71772.1 ribonuclease Y [Thermosulfuriphilus ammonigenes]
MEVAYFALAVLLGLVIGLPLGFVLKARQYEQTVGSAEKVAFEIRDKARHEADQIKKEAQIQAREEIVRLKEKARQELEQEKREIQKIERRLTDKEHQLERRLEQLEKREAELSRRERALKEEESRLTSREAELAEIVAAQKTELEKISGLTTEEAREIILKKVEEEVREDAARIIMRVESEVKEIADRKAKEIIALAIARYAGEYVAEKTVSVVPLPNEEMKGRIIGREGRNIRALEAATGVDLIIDDTPEAVVLSAYSPLRREIARIALERLISDGRIHPARIEEVVRKVEEEMEATIKEVGERVTFDVGVYGIHPELVKLLGRLKYRTSYAQNVLQHSVEVAFLSGLMAGELGLDVKKAKRAGLLHDIGKAVDHEVEGPHALIGAELAKRYGEDEEVVQAIAAHHEDVPCESPLAVLVQAADALSGARPGARREMLETYIKRLEDLERIAYSFPGVQKAFAIQAGREIRIMVDSGRLSDAETALLCRDITKKIEKELTYPGQIKVTVIRETRAIEYAK